MRKVKDKIRGMSGIVWATLQEIFDETAYTRFLKRASMASSSEAYAAFRRESEEARLRRPKCC
jgi:hypothetical protein